VPTPPTTITVVFGIGFGILVVVAAGAFTPTLRLGVTGLSRAGKTIFITALVHNLLTGGRLAGFSPMADGRFIGARLAEYPDAAIPRFAYEQHLEALTGKTPHWPESTRRISQLRLTIRFQSQSWFAGIVGPSQLNLDIVDYPGEWLLDLPLLGKNFAEWSADALERAQRPGSAANAAGFLEALASTDILGDATDLAAEHLASTFTGYLRASRTDGHALSTLPPGRFLLPGDLEGSPALTFAPLPVPEGHIPSTSLYAMLARRFEAYKEVVVRPFFRDHFARLDRQVVLVDTLRALNTGPAAVADLETALTEILSCFRQGDSNPFSRIWSRRIDRILFAATKADHIHSSSHDRLEALLKRLVANAARRAKYLGAGTQSLALAAIRATREGTVTHEGETLPAVVGTPMAGEVLDGVTYDGRTEVALFPGDLPDDPDAVLEDGRPVALNFLRFVPPGKLDHNAAGDLVLPHIRFDRALDFLIGDWLR
jgi:predicted YcjX-like family ATPase